jgi:general secretion pathway protein B
MSYILDALRKTERERQQTEPLIPNPGASEGVELPRRRLGSMAAAALALTGVLAIGAYWMFVTHRPAVILPSTSPASTSHGAPAAGTAAAIKTEIQPAANGVRPAPELRLSPFAAKRPRSAIRDLAKEARVEQAPPPMVETPKAPAPPVTKTDAPVTPAADSPAPAGESIKFLRAMPPEFRRGLPELKVTIHIYAPRAADRILYINNREYHVGEHVGNDVVVKEIVPDGVVLSYHGQLFKLPRPT